MKPVASARTLFILLFVGWLAACGGVREGGGEVRYTVKPGDTLYSIAFSAGMDYHLLAHQNNIAPPYTILPGQELLIRQAPPVVEVGDSRRRLPGKVYTRASSGDSQEATATPPATPQPRKRYRVRPGDTVYSIARKNGTTPGDIARWNGLSGYRIYTGQRLWVDPPQNPEEKKDKNSSKTRKAQTKVRSTPAKSAPAKGKKHWLWPVSGKILQSFNGPGGNKGLDIGGRRGTPIRAAESGTIVYQGSGLRGYGRLIIVKHDKDYLSAYAHCDSFLLKEGNRVKRGQVIAHMGSTGSDQTQLHFEIRYRGNPVDPKKYLPAR